MTEENKEEDSALSDINRYFDPTADSDWLDKCLDVLVSHNLIPKTPVILCLGQEESFTDDQEVKSLWGVVISSFPLESIIPLEEKLLSFLISCRKERKNLINLGFQDNDLFTKE